MNNKEYIATHLSSGTTSQIFSGKGTLHAINVNQTTAVVFGIYDGVTSTSVVVGKLKASVAEQTLLLDAAIAQGLYIENGAGGDYTVLWTK